MSIKANIQVIKLLDGTASYAVTVDAKTISLSPEDISYSLITLNYSYTYIELDAFIDRAGRYRKVRDTVNYTDSIYAHTNKETTSDTLSEDSWNYGFKKETAELVNTSENSNWFVRSLQKSETILHDHNALIGIKKFIDSSQIEEKLDYAFNKKMVDTYSVTSLPVMAFCPNHKEEIITNDTHNLDLNFLVKSSSLVDDYVGVPDGLTYAITRSTKNTIQSFDKKEFYLERTKYDNISVSDSGRIEVISDYVDTSYFAETYISGGIHHF